MNLTAELKSIAIEFAMQTLENKEDVPLKVKEACIGILTEERNQAQAFVDKLDLLLLN